MEAMEAIFVLMLLAATTSALKVFDDYEEYSDFNKQGLEGMRGHDLAGHWSAVESDQVGKGHGEKLQHHHFYGNSGEKAEGGSKAGGHIKHQVTKGYKNYHHKDEVGQTTSFIDTAGDSGDHYGSHEAAGGWGGHEHSGGHRDQHMSEYSRQRGEAKENSGQKEDDYKGNIAELLYAKKPAFYSKQFYSRAPLHHIPYSYYFY